MSEEKGVPNARLSEDDGSGYCIVSALMDSHVIAASSKLTDEVRPAASKSSPESWTLSVSLLAASCVLFLRVLILRWLGLMKKKKKVRTLNQ